MITAQSSKVNKSHKVGTCKECFHTNHIFIMTLIAVYISAQIKINLAKSIMLFALKMSFL